MSENTDIDTIANRLTTAQDNIQQFAKKSSRSATNIKLMAVSKTKPNHQIEAAYQSGQRIFGENYAQELANKAETLNHLTDIEWHYIGPIQSNKTKIIAQAAHWVDSVDRLKIAQRLNQHCLELDKSLQVLLQVNISRTDSKSGVMLEDVATLAKEVAALPNITLRGLMAIPHQYEDKQLLAEEFSQMNTCFLALQQQYPTVDTLSLGMSGDMQVAIENGSTMVRIGTAIFGKRETKTA